MQGERSESLRLGEAQPVCRSWKSIRAREAGFVPCLLVFVLACK